MIQKFDSVYLLLSETLREFIYLERMQEGYPYSRVPHVCHVLKDCYVRSGTDTDVYEKASELILGSIKGSVYENHLLKADGVFYKLSSERYATNTLEDMKVAQQKYRDYLSSSKITWLYKLIDKAKKEGI